MSWKHSSIDDSEPDLTDSPGALVGGLIISYSGWRVIFYVQAGLVALGLILSLIFVPSIAQTEYEEVEPSFRFWIKAQIKIVARVAVMLVQPNVLLGVSSLGILDSLMSPLSGC